MPHQTAVRGRKREGREKGVVRDPQVHMEVIRTVFAVALDKGFDILNLDFSPIRGPEGNIEYLMHLVREEQPAQNFDSAGFVQEHFAGIIMETVVYAHQTLDN